MLEPTNYETDHRNIFHIEHRADHVCNSQSQTIVKAVHVPVSASA